MQSNTTKEGDFPRVFDDGRLLNEATRGEGQAPRDFPWPPDADRLIGNSKYNR